MTASATTRPTRRSRLALAVCAGIVLASAGTASAQQAAPDGAQAEDLDRVVVTANKREENIREVGASISVVGERQLENMGASSLSDYAALIPGMQVQNNGSPGLTAVSLRGISALSSGATVATYIDEVPVGSSGIYQGANMFMLDLLPYDINRVEVLRGPQGTLYGAGAIGGLLKYVTRAPDLAGEEFRVGVGLRSVQDGGQDWNARVGISVPLQEDRLGLRASFARNGLPGYTDNAIDGRSDINDAEQIGGRVALSWRGDAVDADLSVLHQRIKASDRATVALDPDTYAPLDGELTGRTWQRAPFSKELTLASLSLSWDLGWADFVSATGWSETKTMEQIDSTVQFGEVADLMLGLPEPGSSYVRYGFDLDKVTQEFRLSSKTGGRFEWMAGVFYTKEDALQSQFAWLGQRNGQPLAPPLDAMFGTLAMLELPSTYEEVALFVNGSWRVTDRFKIDAGLRQARNDQWFSQNVSAGILAPIGDAPGESSEDVFTWSLSPQFQLADDVMLYARVATGYQPGGPNVALVGMPPSVDSSMLDSYEVGMKAQFADRRAQLDVSAFRIDWEDIQVASSFNGIGGLVNGGEASSEGLELATQFRATDALLLGFNAAYTKARVKNDFAPTIIPVPDEDGNHVADVNLTTGLAGDRMPYVPKLSWAASAEYGFSTAGGLVGQVGAVLRWSGDRYNDTTERQRVTLPGDPSTVLQEQFTAPLLLESHRALDLYAGIGRDSWEVRAYINNATGEKAWSSMNPAAGAVSGVVSHLAAVPIQPRTFGLEFDFRF